MFVQLSLVSVALGMGILCGCAVNHPCQDAGQPARDAAFRGDKQCYQKKDASGHWVNHGKYVEYYPDGKRALEGFYSEGLKDGVWVEWDERGRKTSEKHYANGVEGK